MALGLAKVGGVPAAVVTTSGTATANLYPAVIEASHAQVPMILLTADRPPELRDTGAGQTIDQIKLFGDAVRWFVEVGVAEAGGVRGVLALAGCPGVGVSRWPAAGPVHLNLAFRNPLVPVADEAGFPHPLDGREGGMPWTEESHSPRAASPEDLSGCVRRSRAPKRGIDRSGDRASQRRPDTGYCTQGRLAGAGRGDLKRAYRPPGHLDIRSFVASTRVCRRPPPGPGDPRRQPGNFTWPRRPARLLGSPDLYRPQRLAGPRPGVVVDGASGRR